MSELHPSQSRVSIDYAGGMRPLFLLVLQTTFLTIITLGIYRFWMKARMRGYYWSAILPNDTPLEYSGTGLEKLLGFFIAVVILAIYLGIFQLILTFLGLSYFAGGQWQTMVGLNLSLLAVFPLIYFAQYRARRYILSRTRWRGVRFGMEVAGLKYAAYAVGQSIITVLSLGLLMPRQTYNLEKFRTDRTWFGDLRLRQGGRWQMIFRPWLTFYGVLVIGFSLGWLGNSTGQEIYLLLGATAIYLGGALAFLYYSVSAFRELTNHKEAGKEIRFSSKVRVGSVLRIYTLGGIIVFCVLSLLFIALAFAIGTDFSLDLNLVSALATPSTAVIYLVFLLLFGALTQVFITQPLLAHYMTTLAIENAAELDHVAQREEDDMVEAEGFADALDVGAAI